MVVIECRSPAAAEFDRLSEIVAANEWFLKGRATWRTVYSHRGIGRLAYCLDESARQAAKAAVEAAWAQMELLTA